MKAISLLIILLFFCFKSQAQLQAPTLDIPSKGAYNISISPKLQIVGNGDAIAEFELDTVNTFTSGIKQNLFSHTTDWYEKEWVRPQFLDFHKKYFWRCRLTMSGDTSDWSDIWSFTTLYKPTLGYPTNNAIVNPSSFYWQDAGTLQYLLEVDTSENFSSAALKRVFVKDTVFSKYGNVYGYTTHLFFATKHYWRVKGFHGTDSSEWSETWNFTLLDTPEITSPVDKYISSKATLSLQWKEFYPASHYEIQYDTSAQFNSFALVDTVIGRPNKYPMQHFIKNLYFNKNYFWRIRAINPVDTSAWSHVWQFQTPSVVNLKSPYYNATYIDINGKHTWLSIADSAISYEFAIDTNNKFNSPLFKSDVITTSNTVATNQRYDTRYYWKVRAINKFDTSEWSVVNTYMTQSRLQTILLNPKNNAKDIEIVQDFQWAADGLYSIIEIDTTLTFNSPILVSDSIYTVGTSYPKYQLSDLYFNATYYWRVKNYSVSDSQKWSSVYTFTTVAAPTAYFPYQDQLNFGVETNILVNAMKGVSQYLWELDTMPDFSSKIIRRGTSNSETAYPGDELYFNRWYYWHFKAINANDTSEWSSLRRFQSTTTVFLFAPKNKSTGISNKVPLDIGGISGATGYEILISKNASFDGATPLKVMGQANTKITVPLPYNTLYYWKARAFHTKDTSNWSDVWQFTTKAAPFISSPIPKIPENNLKNVPLGKVTFAWDPNGVSATSYDFQIGSNMQFDTLLYDGNLVQPYAAITGFNLYSHTYFWRVRNHADTLVSNWSYAARFTTEDKPSTIENLLKDDISITIMPNPFSKNLRIHSNATKILSVQLYDLLGNNLSAKTSTQGINIRFDDMSEFPSGIYILKIETEKGSIFRKVLKE